MESISTPSRIRRITVIIYYKTKIVTTTPQTHIFALYREKIPAGMKGFEREKECQTTSIM